MVKKIVRKNGKNEAWDSEKIRIAIKKSNERAKSDITVEQMDNIIKEIERIKDFELVSPITTLKIHDVVLDVLQKYSPETYIEYKAFRNYKERYASSFDNTRIVSENIIKQGDKENANKDSNLNSTKQALIGEGIMRELMLNFELSPKWVKAHEEGWIHIHDLSQRYLRQINCCLFDMGNLLKGGFELNGVIYIEPKSIQTAFAVIGDVTLSASSQQLGGFTIPEIDSILAPYAEKTYHDYIKKFEKVLDRNVAIKLAYDATIREIEQGYQGFETKLNTVSNSLGQVPFVTITFGMEISQWGNIISETILDVREKGLGATKVTAIFPKLVYLHLDGINGDKDDINYKSYLKAIECSRKRLYPDYLSLDEGNLSEIYNRCGQIVSPMGCRAYLSPFYNGEKEIYTGRNNIGAVTLNLPKIALESKGNLDVFYSLIRTYSEMIFDIHLDYYEKVGKQKGSSNPLLFCEGGSWKSVGYNDNIAPILEASTASLGYVGIEETSQALFGKSIVDNKDFALELVGFLKGLTEEASNEYNKLFALYSTPAESLIYKFQKLNREQYGVIENVTDREYMTNSFHVHVSHDISIPEKIIFESDFHKLATGGRISYNEFKFNAPTALLKQSVDFAMKKGLYYGVNMISATCGDCGYQGDFDDKCPSCSSEDITSISRCCGYLSYGKVKGDTRYNIGKQAEIKDRVKHNMRKEDLL